MKKQSRNGAKGYEYINRSDDKIKFSPFDYEYFKVGREGYRLFNI